MRWYCVQAPIIRNANNGSVMREMRRRGRIRMYRRMTWLITDRNHNVHAAAHITLSRRRHQTGWPGVLRASPPKRSSILPRHSATGSSASSSRKGLQTRAHWKAPKTM